MLAPCILVLEDEPLIALDLEYTLNEAGFRNVTLLSCCKAAREHISQDTPSLAIVDIYLKDGTCAEVCRELASRNVPIIVSSASSDRDPDDVFKDLVWLCKPIVPTELLEAVAKALVNRDLGELDDSAPESETAARHVTAWRI